MRVRRSLKQMIDYGFESYVRCRKCLEKRRINLPKLMAKVGPDYSLWNRRCKCKLTPGCDGWNVFCVGPGWHTPDYSEAIDNWWMAKDWEAEKGR